MAPGKRHLQTAEIEDLVPNHIQFYRPRDANPAIVVDPEDPILARNQLRLATSLAEGRIWGLTREIYNIAESEGQVKLDSATNFTSTYAKLVADRDSAGYVFQLLCTHSREVLRHLICNDIFSASHEDDKLREYIEKNQMKPKALPAVYVVGICRAERRGIEFPGRYLSANEISDLLDFVRGYSSHGTLTTPQADADSVGFDAEFPAKHSADIERTLDPKQRRYCPSSMAMERTTMWYKCHKETFIDGIRPIETRIEDSKRSIPFARVPCYVGVTNFHDRRAAEHKRNENTSYLLGLANAYTQYRTQKDASDQCLFEEVSLAVFHLWSNDKTYCQVAEATATVLTSSFMSHGGFSLVSAGGSSPKADQANYYALNEQRMFPQASDGLTGLVIQRMNEEAAWAFGIFDSPFQRLKQCRDKLASQKVRMRDIKDQLSLMDIKQQERKQKIAITEKEVGDTSEPWTSPLRARLESLLQTQAATFPHFEIQEPLGQYVEDSIDRARALDNITTEYIQEEVSKRVNSIFPADSEQSGSGEDANRGGTPSTEESSLESDRPSRREALLSLRRSCGVLRDAIKMFDPLDLPEDL